MHKNENSFTIRAALVLAMYSLTMLLSSTNAQTGTSTVRGTVTDHLGAVIANATVTVFGAKDFIRSQETGDDGVYAFKALPPDTYIIEVRAVNFKGKEVSGVISEANRAIEVNIQLELDIGEVSADALVRERVTDVLRPIAKFRRTSFMSMCGSRSYLIKDAAGGYLMFTLHTPDMPDWLTIDNPRLSLESQLDVDEASTFVKERPLAGTEKVLLIKLLREWRDSAIPEQKQRMFKHNDGLKDEVAKEKAFKSLSEEDSELLSLWWVIQELENKLK